MWSYSQFSGLLKRKDKSRPLKELCLTLKLSSLNVVGSLAVALYTLMLYCFRSVLNVELEKGTYIVFQMIDYLSWHLLWEFY
jgi:hypothetical protein